LILERFNPKDYKSLGFSVIILKNAFMTTGRLIMSPENWVALLERIARISMDLSRLILSVVMLLICLHMYFGG
ncbi:hypothetical protein, partial [Escherichia coli]|uniref:hypothetical protein n=3 Tax=Enterobacterales TaxID=91347 RepID=UPI001B8C0F9A